MATASPPPLAVTGRPSASAGHPASAGGRPASAAGQPASTAGLPAAIPAPREAPSAASPLHLRARNLGVRRSGKDILRHIDFDARSGELVAVLGPSGCGKSTLLHALSGFRPPTEGELRLGLHDLRSDPEAARGLVGFVPQDDVVPLQLRVERVLDYAARLRLPDLEEETRRHRIEGVLRTLGMVERRRLRVDRLSGGQRKRVSVAVELLARPRVLFADEPTSGLDPAMEAGLMEVFRKMADAGALVILTTHIMGSLRQVDRIVLLHEGRLVFTGSADAMRAHFAVDDLAEVYHTLSRRPVAEWARRWKERRP